MPSAPSKLYADDVSLLVVTIDTNPFFWTTFPFPFSDFISQVLAFLNSILLLGQLNQVVVIATGCNSCGYVYDSGSDKNHGSTNGSMPALYSNLLHNLDEFLSKDQQLATTHAPGTVPSSLLSGSLSKALCYIQRAFREGPMHPQPRILCLQGSADGPEQYVAIMNAIFSAQRSTVPVDSCYIGSNNSAFLQQASFITGGIYYRPPQLEGLFQYLSVCFELGHLAALKQCHYAESLTSDVITYAAAPLTVFATDLHSRAFLRLPKSMGVDFRASCFCHKQTIDMGYVCSVCLSIFCEHHDKCSTCGSVFGQAAHQVQADVAAANWKRKA